MLYPYETITNMTVTQGGHQLRLAQELVRRWLYRRKQWKLEQGQESEACRGKEAGQEKQSDEAVVLAALDLIAHAKLDPSSAMSPATAQVFGTFASFRATSHSLVDAVTAL